MVDGEAFGERLRALMRARGASYRTLADRIYQSKTYVHNLATGRTAPSIDVARRLDAALCANGELMALARTDPPSAPSVDAPSAVSETGEVLRRTVLAVLASITASQVVSQPAIAEVLGGLIERGRPGSTVDDWQETVWEYGYSYLSAPRDDLLRRAITDLAALQAMLPGARGGRRAGLHDAAARLAGLIAMVCTDLGHHTEARTTWRMARRLARDSGSIDCEMWVRGQEAITGLYAPRPLPLLLDLAQQGLAVGPERTTPGAAVLLAAKAQVLATLDAEQVPAVMDRLRKTFDALPESATHNHASIFGWAERRLRHVESNVASRLGSTAAAHHAHDAAAALTTNGARCQIEVHRAARLVSDGYVTEGINHATSSLSAIPLDQHGRYVLTLAAKVLDRVPMPTARRPVVTDYRDMLEHAGRTESQ